MQLSRDDLKRAYRSMYTIRVFEERVTKEFALGNIPGFAHVYIGQEASGVGVCFDLSNDDYIGSTHRGHGHCIAKGSSVEGMMLEIYAREGGLCGGKGGSMHIADLSVGMLGANGIAEQGQGAVEGPIQIQAGGDFGQDAQQRLCVMLFMFKLCCALHHALFQGSR